MKSEKAKDTKVIPVLNVAPLRKDEWKHMGDGYVFYYESTKKQNEEK